MNFKLLLGIFVPLIVAVALVILSSINIGLSVEVETEKSVQFNSLFTYQYDQKDNVLIQTITIDNDYFLPRKFELPVIIACLNVKEGLSRRTDMQVKYSEGKYASGSDIPFFQDLFYDSYSYRSPAQSIEIPANGKKQLKVLVVPKYVYSDQIDSYKGYDELLLVQSKEKRGYAYNLCQDLYGTELENAVHIDTIGKLDKPSVECKDSDGGKDYYVKGTTTFYGKSYEDFCKNGTEGMDNTIQLYEGKYLNEGFCVDENTFSSINYECPNGCKDGACILIPPKFGNITINSPNGGETWAKGMSHYIEWTSSGFGNDAEAQIQLRDALNSEKIVKLITLSTLNTGRYSWTVSDDIPEGQYLLWITVMSGNDILSNRVLGSDYSDSAFSIPSK